MSLVNYLGTYETLDQVWETYPEGGKEGDYLYIASVLKKWNKYTYAWVDATEEDVEGSTIMSLEEDVVVGSSTLINYLGRFETLENAINTYPEGGNEGDYIYVGDDIYAWDKYANGWFVSSDTPLEVAISEEDIILYSNTFINYHGGFVDRDAVWHKYPEGGKVGDYLYIASDLHIWDKYICNWVAATPPDESSQIRPIEHLSQEGVVEYSENYINYLGVFESIEQAWEAYPEGGKEGDYIIVGGEQLRWNKYTSNWGEYDPDASTPARPVATIYGDLHVHNDVIIGEDLYARILEAFTTKKWVLEQGYISMDDVTSELVMSKIVPDNTTIEVRDGKLVVIGGGGGGTADSVAWDDVTGKPDWIGDTKPTYTLDEIAGSNGDGFVTRLSDQTIEGVKNFTAGVQFGGLPMYKSKDDTVYLDGNLVVRGAVTMYGMNTTTSPSIFSALPIDGTTIGRNERGELYVIGGTGGGGVADSVAWRNVTNKPTWITDTKPKYSYSEILDTPDLSVKADKATTLAGYGITNAYTKSEVNNIIDSLDDTYVTIAGEEQSITAEHNFVNGFKVGGLPIKKSQDKTLYLDANLVVSGAITMYGSDSTTFPTIWANIPFNLEHMSWDGSQWSVVGSSGSGSGLDYDMLDDYLTINGYAKQDWVTGKGYITSSALEPYALKTAIPTSLKNPNALSWSGYSSGSYDGSTAQSITIPNNTNQLNNGAGFITSITSSMVTNALGYTPVAVSIGLTSADNNAIGYGYYEGGWPEAGPAMVFGVGNYKAGVHVGAFGSAIRYGYTAGATSFTWRTILDDNNYSDYALPLTGGTVDGSLHIGGSLYPTNIKYYGSGKVIWHNDDNHYFIDCPNGVLTYQAYSGHSFLGGNVAIGGTTATEKFHLYGNMLFDGERVLKSSLIGEVLYMGGSYLVIGGGTTTKGIPTYIDGKTVYVRAGNYVATFSDAGELTWNGNLLTKGAITMYYSSDRRLKQNIRKVNASDVLMSLGGVYQYEYIDSEVAKNSTYEGSHYGLIYQNVKGTALSTMCHEREDGMGALNYVDADFISIIAGATMENISEIEQVKRENRELRKELEQLKQRVHNGSINTNP